MSKKADRTTRYIANRAFGGLRKFSGYLKHRQIVDLAFKMNKLKQNTTLWLSANLKVYRFLLPYLPYTKRYGQLSQIEESMEATFWQNINDRLSRKVYILTVTGEESDPNAPQKEVGQNFNFLKTK